MNGVELHGLRGNNPLAYFATLGVLAVLERVGPDPPTLRWSNGVVAHPVVTGASGVQEIAELVMTDHEAWLSSPALGEFGSTRHDDVKLDPEQLADYLRAAQVADDGGRSLALASALAPEGCFDGNQVAKPTDFHFTAGQQKFLAVAREIRDGVTATDVVEALVGPWAYRSELKTLKWDVSDDRVFALSAKDPSTTPKQTMPGAEWLGLLGLPSFPVFRRDERRTATTGCQGKSWKAGTFTWPIWSEPLSFDAVRSLVAQDFGYPTNRWERWGVVCLLRSVIRRSDQGGYGTFGPPLTVWEAQ